jgi:tRNA A37 threonylcarbamoyladenosine modification protein TsaB
MKKITLIIDTSDKEEIKLSLEKDNQFLSSKKIKAVRSQSEKLLVSIDQFLLKIK